MIKHLSHGDLKKISRANIIAYITNVLDILEKDIFENRLNEEISLEFINDERKIHINNLLKIFEILHEKEEDPYIGILFSKYDYLLPLLQALEKSFHNESYHKWVSAKFKNDPRLINEQLTSFVQFLEKTRMNIVGKMRTSFDNSHLKKLYHPKFPHTYVFKPRHLPEDYRSNFFFEIKIQELCPYTTLLVLHPYSDMQVEYPSNLSVSKLIDVDVNIDTTDPEKLEKTDNIRAMRLQGPKDSKAYPGSYILVRGGHHRLRELYIRYLRGEIPGNFKFLVQLVGEDDFISKEVLREVKKRIKEHEKNRSRIVKIFTKLE